MIKVIIADDHQIIVDGISGLLANETNMEVVAYCKNGEEVLEILPQINADVLLLDLDMPKMDGLQCTLEINNRFPDVKISILTMHQEKSLIEIGGERISFKNHF